MPYYRRPGHICSYGVQFETLSWISALFALLNKHDNLNKNCQKFVSVNLVQPADSITHTLTSVYNTVAQLPGPPKYCGGYVRLALCLISLVPASRCIEPYSSLGASVPSSRDVDGTVPTPWPG